MAGWHHQLDGRESEWTPGVGDGQGGLACCDSWGCNVGYDRATEMNWTELNLPYYLRKFEGLMVKLKSNRKEVQVSQPDMLLALRLFWYTHVLWLWCKITTSPQYNQIPSSSSKSTPSGPRFYKSFYLFIFFSAMLCGMGSTRDQTSMPALETKSLNPWTIKEVPRSLHFEKLPRIS